MKYRNPQIPEGINVTRTHPLKEFLVLGGGALLLILVLAFALGQFGGQVARLLPFEHEAKIAPDELLGSDAPPALQSYLDDLAARLIPHMDLPEGMRIHLNVNGGETLNAFATLGGNVLLYRGLLERLPHENALSMLLAHEMAHVLHRDPIVGIGQGASVQLVFGLLFGDPNLSALGNAGLYTQLHFHRDMETDADAAALVAVQGVYGHVAGARALFDVLQAARESSGSGEMPAFFSTHPLDQARIDAIGAAAAQAGWSQTGETTPLPAAFDEWMRQAAANASDAEQAD